MKNRPTLSSVKSWQPWRTALKTPYLCDDVAQRILNKLDAYDAVRAGSTCKAWYALTRQRRDLATGLMKHHQNREIHANNLRQERFWLPVMMTAQGCIWGFSDTQPCAPLPVSIVAAVAGGACGLIVDAATYVPIVLVNYTTHRRRIARARSEEQKRYIAVLRKIVSQIPV